MGWAHPPRARATTRPPCAARRRARARRRRGSRRSSAKDRPVRPDARAGAASAGACGEGLGALASGERLAGAAPVAGAEGAALTPLRSSRSMRSASACSGVPASRRARRTSAISTTRRGSAASMSSTTTSGSSVGKAWASSSRKASRKAMKASSSLCAVIWWPTRPLAEASPPKMAQLWSSPAAGILMGCPRRRQTFASVG